MLHSVHKVFFVMPNGCRIVFISLHSHGILWWAVPRPGCLAVRTQVHFRAVMGSQVSNAYWISLDVFSALSLFPFSLRAGPWRPGKSSQRGEMRDIKHQFRLTFRSQLPRPSFSHSIPIFLQLTDSTTILRLILSPFGESALSGSLSVFLLPL